MKTIKNNISIFRESYETMNFNGKKKVSSWTRFSPIVIMIYLHYRYSKNCHDQTWFMTMLGMYVDFRQRKGLNMKKPPYEKGK